MKIQIIMTDSRIHFFEKRGREYLIVDWDDMKCNSLFMPYLTTVIVEDAYLKFAERMNLNVETINFTNDYYE